MEMEEVEEEFGTEVGLKKTRLDTSQNSCPSASNQPRGFTSDAGEGCVAACETLVGWVIRNKQFVAFSVIPITSIFIGDDWGRNDEN